MTSPHIDNARQPGASRKITAARTGAGAALSARLLARADATVLAILGTGVQALSHARAFARVRPLSEIGHGSASLAYGIHTLMTRRTPPT